MCGVCFIRLNNVHFSEEKLIKTNELREIQVCFESIYLTLLVYFIPVNDLKFATLQYVSVAFVAGSLQGH